MIDFSTHSGIHTLESTQDLPLTIQEAWDFFSSPHNLIKITPDHMGFKITNTPAEKMYIGQIITYKIGLVPGVSSSWVTEITHVEEGRYFIDEQRFGPYSMWHHEHWFFPIEGGIRMTDLVSYKVPMGLLGMLVEKIYIRGQLNRIFSYRENVLNQMFPWKDNS